MSRPRSPVARWLPGLLALLTAAPSHAAPVTWADSAGLCNGEAPCFTTLAAAVANAGPPPATVFVFPGTYAESVDLGQMGSAIGGAPGDLAVVSVDAAGQPAPGTVVDAGAPGGPGTGRAIEAISFPGALTVDGLVLRSPDTHGLLVALAVSPVRLSHLVASGNPGGTGVLVLGDPASQVVAEDLRAEGNGGSGLALGAGRVEATGLTARNNGEAGILLGGTELVGRLLVAEGNAEVGVQAVLTEGAATFDLAEITVRGNQTGLVVVAGAWADPVTGTLANVAAASHANAGIITLVHGLTATALTATQNDNGIVLSVRDRLEAVGLGAFDNAGTGIAAVSRELRLASSVAQGNLTGIATGGDWVVIEGSTASGSGPAGAGPFDGAGFVVVASRLDASGNTANGNQIGWIFDDADPFTAALSGLRGLPAVPLSRWEARGTPLPPQQLTLLRGVTEGNLAGSMQVRLREQGHLDVACSDFLGNGPPGLDLATDHVVDAHFNFWGEPSGPTHPRNPGGTGDAIRDGDNGGAGTVLFGGFLGAPATDADCPVVAVAEVPALGPLGLGLLALALAVVALGRLRR